MLKYVFIVSFEQHNVQLYCQVAMFTSLQMNKLLLLVKPNAKQELCFGSKSDSDSVHI